MRHSDLFVPLLVDGRFFVLWFVSLVRWTRLVGRGLAIISLGHAVSIGVIQLEVYDRVVCDVDALHAFQACWSSFVWVVFHSEPAIGRLDIAQLTLREREFENVEMIHFENCGES